MNIEEMKQLRRVVEAAPEDRLHMRAFSERAACGTAHCAAGWAALDPWFQENTEINEFLSVVFSKRYGCVYLSEDGDVFEGLGQIFGLSPEETTNLFAGNLHVESPAHCVTKQEVLDNIDRLLKGESAVPYREVLEPSVQ